MPGAVLILVRNGKIVTDDAFGYQDRAEQTPMKKDSIFGVASRSNPIDVYMDGSSPPLAFCAVGAHR